MHTRPHCLFAVGHPSGNPGTGNYLPIHPPLAASICFPPLSRYFVQGFVLSCPASFPGFRRSLCVMRGPVFLPSCGRACFVVRTRHILLMRSSVDGHWGRWSLRLLRVLLQPLCPHTFLFGSVSSSLGCIPGSGTAGSGGDRIWLYERAPSCPHSGGPFPIHGFSLSSVPPVPASWPCFGPWEVALGGLPWLLTSGWAPPKGGHQRKGGDESQGV